MTLPSAGLPDWPSLGPKQTYLAALKSPSLIFLINFVSKEKKTSDYCLAQVFCLTKPGSFRLRAGGFNELAPNQVVWPFLRSNLAPWQKIIWRPCIKRLQETIHNINQSIHCYTYIPSIDVQVRHRHPKSIPFYHINISNEHPRTNTIGFI